MKRRQVAILAGGVLLGIGLGVGLSWRGRRHLLRLVWIDEDVLTEAGGPLVGPALAEEAAGRLRRAPIPEETARRIMPQLDATRDYDPFCYFRAKPLIETWMPWAEYPGGRFRIATNSLGLRTDHEPLATADLRVLLVGDSHTTGVCANADCVAGRLESLLLEEDPTRAVDVQNGSNGGYSFYNYLGVLERMIELSFPPDRVVVVVYGGNDFLGVNLWHLFSGTHPRQSPEVVQRRRAVGERYRFAMGQVLNAADYFRVLGPEEQDRALHMAREVTREMRRRCDEIGARLLVVYLPAPSEVPEQADLTDVRAASEALELAPEDLDRIGEMGDRYLAELAQLSIATLDLRPAFRAASEALYWRRDLHLNLAGQDLAARAILPLVASRDAAK